MNCPLLIFSSPQSFEIIVFDMLSGAINRVALRCFHRVFLSFEPTQKTINGVLGQSLVFSFPLPLSS